ncbi:MAG: diguanylate cyclase [Betaproteobacteria bacterium]|nr:diguanylate cyclase [Betaproteobacteria bacterium]
MDDSRIVRASIIKSIRDRCDYREEVDGEAAWQTLVLDPSIQLLISDLTMPKLDGFGLLERLRSSDDKRLKNLPVMMISGDEDEEVLNHAKALGVSDFIAKGTPSAEIIARIEALLSKAQQAQEKQKAQQKASEHIHEPETPKASQETPSPKPQPEISSPRQEKKATETQHEAPQTQHEQEAPKALQEMATPRDSQIVDPETGLFSRRYLELQVSQALPRVFRYNSELSVLTIGFDAYQKLREGVGEKVINQLLLRLSRLLVKKVRKEDSFGHFIEGVFAIASPQTSESSCMQFANRLREAIGVASVPGTHGQRLKLSVSVGLAHSPTDTVNAPEELFDLALRRMRQAESMGGNRVIGCSTSGRPLVSIGLDRAAHLLKAGHTDALGPHILALGERILPLLRFLDHELDAGTDFSELEQRLTEQESTTTIWT